MDESAKFGKSFFERLDQHESEVVMDGDSDSELIVNSVKRNIAQLLNSRKGESLSAPQIGLMDFNDANLGSRELGEKISKSINNCLEQYEPRVSNVRASWRYNQDDPLGLRFNVLVKLDTSGFSDTVELDLLLDNNKHYRVF